MADDAALAHRVSTLSLEQKVRLLTGADFWALHAEPAVGLRRLVTSDGPAGVRGELWDERSTSANVPSPTALAATWDERRIERLGGLLAAEARRKGVDVLLAPTVNLHRTPYGGRHFECFSEDPLLTARIGVAYVRGVQGGGVAATVKHFVANDSETERMTCDVRLDERVLRELYLPPFEAIVREAGVWAVMAAYNRVHGVTMTESPLLRRVLHTEWAFDGVVMSDWTATRSVVESARAGLDLAMPGPQSPWTGGALVDAVRRGEVSEDLVDDKVVRILRLAQRVGGLDGAHPAPPPDWPPDAVAAELRGTAAAGVVLAQNTGGLLPLDRSALRQVAVLGPNAAVARTLGGGSATVFPPYTVSPLDGLRAALGDAAVVTSPGVRAHTRAPVGGAPWLRLPDGSGPGLEVVFRAADGSELGREVRGSGAFNWTGSFGVGIPADAVRTVEVRTTLRAGEAGTYAVGGSGTGRFRLRVDGDDVVDTVLELPPGADVVEGLMKPPQALHALHLDADVEVDVVLAHELAADTAGGTEFVTFQLNVQPPARPDDEEIERAVALAAASDVAVVVVGTTEEIESEGFDRVSLALPGRQDELVRRVVEANPRTVVVVNAGAPVLLPWADLVPAVLLAWFPGQEAGNALADLLLGAVEPGGRLPVTWPAAEQGLPSTQPVDGVLRYDEGLHVGHRRGTPGPPVQYPFGSGLGYTSWDLVDVAVPPAPAGGGGDLRVTVRVRNTGSRAGRHVVQAYLSRAESGIERPARWLAGFAAVEAGPGEEATADLLIRWRAFAHWSAEDSAWAVEPGAYTLEVGHSSADLPHRTTVSVG
jgi:beta-glucosidase